METLRRVRYLTDTLLPNNTYRFVRDRAPELRTVGTGEWAQEQAASWLGAVTYLLDGHIVGNPFRDSGKKLLAICAWRHAELQEVSIVG